MTLTNDSTYGLKHRHHHTQQPQQNNDPNQWPYLWAQTQAPSYPAATTQQSP